MDIIRIAKNHQAGIRKMGKASSREDWKLSDSLREMITEYAREDAAQNIYMGNKFLALRKSEVAKVAPDRVSNPDTLFISDTISDTNFLLIYAFL